MNYHKKTVLFDFDGTIADTFDAVVCLANSYAHQNNFSALSNEQITTLRTQGTRALLSCLPIPTYKLPFVIKTLLTGLENKIRILKPFEGVERALRELKKNDVLLGIVTSNSHQNVHAFLQSNDLDIFDFTRCGKSLFGKDVALKSLISKNELNPDNIVYVGDEIRDIQAARKARIKSLAVAWGYNDQSLLASNEPDHLCIESTRLYEAIIALLS